MISGIHSELNPEMSMMMDDAATEDHFNLKDMK